jgi:hypothetical protein
MVASRLSSAPALPRRSRMSAFRVKSTLNWSTRVASRLQVIPPCKPFLHLGVRKVLACRLLPRLLALEVLRSTRRLSSSLPPWRLHLSGASARVHFERARFVGAPLCGTRARLRADFSRRPPRRHETWRPTDIPRRRSPGWRIFATIRAPASNLSEPQSGVVVLG